MPGRHRQTRRAVATVFFTDIVGSTALAARLGDQTWRELLTLYHGVVRRAIRRDRGRQVDSAGDGVFAVFTNPAAAIRCAMAATDELHGIGIEVRSGLHTGEVEFMGDKVGGIAVHLGARTCSEAGAGEILLTSTVRDLIEGSGIHSVDRGTRALKGIPGRWRIYALVRPDAVPLDQSALDTIATQVVRSRRRRWRLLAIRIGLAAALLFVVAAALGLVAWLHTSTPQPTQPVISTVAGTGVRGQSPDGQAATATNLTQPAAIAIDPQGRLYIVEDDRVLRVERGGTVVTIAGTGHAGSAGDEGPATAGDLNNPRAVAVDNAGNIYITDSGNNRVRRVDVHGVIHAFAGTGERGGTGDGGPATQAGLDAPTGIAIGFGGTVLIADSGNNRIRAVVSGGIIATIGGTGDAGYAGDGGPATSAILNDPQCLAVDAENSIYVADILNDRVRRIDAAGVIATLAGTGNQGFSGDGGAASRAELRLASGPVSGAGCLSLDITGDLFIADALNNRVRRVAVDGTITTIAGDGQAGAKGDNGVATEAQLALPLGVATDRAGAVYIADSANDRVRRVA